jgi:hypothetical protein
MPTHDAPTVATPPAQLGGRHTVGTSGYVQSVRSVPLQTPPQTEPSLAHALRPPTGAPVTAVHVPVALATLHASH